MPGGRPTDYSPEIAAEICRRIAEGESLRAICADEAMPSKTTVLNWLQADRPEFLDQYARAREAQADTLFDEMLEIADDSSRDMKQVPVGDEGASVEVVDHEHIARSRLRVETRKHMASILKPKVYGRRVALTGADGGAIETRGTERASPKVVNDLVQIFGRVVLQYAPTGAPADTFVENAAADPAGGAGLLLSGPRPARGGGKRRRAAKARKKVVGA